MVGFAKSRFVNLSTTDDAELTCGICLDIFNKPMVVKCCRQMYCDECIRLWLKTNENCPYDRRLISIYDLSEPPRMVHNMISSLTIRCNYENFGCKEIIKLDELRLHEANCKFNNEKLCVDCGLKLNDEDSHDCIFKLKAINISLKQEIKSIREENISLKSKQLNKNEIFNKTLKSARDASGCIINENKILDPKMVSELINTCRLAIQDTDTSSIGDISKFIWHRLNENEEKTLYHVIVYYNGIGESFVTNDKYYINLSFGNMRFEIFTAGKKEIKSIKKSRKGRSVDYPFIPNFFD